MGIGGDKIFFKQSTGVVVVVVVVVVVFIAVFIISGSLCVYLLSPRIRTINGIPRIRNGKHRDQGWHTHDQEWDLQGSGMKLTSKTVRDGLKKNQWNFPLRVRSQPASTLGKKKKNMA